MSEGNEESSSLRDTLGAAYDAATKEGEATEQVVPEAKPEQTTAETNQASEVAAETPIDAPVHWSDEHKETFKGLPRQAQQFVLDRHRSMESDYTRKTTELSERSKQYDRYASFDKLFEPYRPRLQAMGLDESGAIQRLLNAQSMLERDPKSALAQLAKQYGVEFGEAGSNQFADPDLQRVSQELAQLKMSIAQREQAEQQTRQGQLLGEIEAFKSSKDETGNPKYPHFDKLRPAIAGLLHAGDAKDLADAYDRAAWAHPEVRTEILERQRKTEAEATAKAAAEKARDAQGRFLPNGKGIPKTEAPAKESLRQELDRRLKEAGMHN